MMTRKLLFLSMLWALKITTSACRFYEQAPFIVTNIRPKFFSLICHFGEFFFSAFVQLVCHMCKLVLKNEYRIEFLRITLCILN
jgi:hypothetical protein